MATAGDGAAPYEGVGAGGKFRKRPIRRGSQATPYDRPLTAIRNNNPSLFSKLMDPASRLIYAGAHRLFGAFRKRLPSLPPQGHPEANKEPRIGVQETGPNNCTRTSELSTDHGGNLTSISAAADISELEQILKQKTFTRSEIERLTELLNSRTTESPSGDVNEGGGSKLPTTTHPLRFEASVSGMLNKQGDEKDNLYPTVLTPLPKDVGERDGAKLPSTSRPLLLEASTSGLLNKHEDNRDNIHAAASTPVVGSRVLEEDVASPAELAKAYMGTRPTKVSQSTLGLSSQAMRQESMLLNNRTVLPKTPIMSLAPKTAGTFRGLENGFTTPRSRGRSAMYGMSRTPYSRGPSAFSQKGVGSDFAHGAASSSLRSSQSAWEYQGPFGSNNMSLKRRSSVLDDDIKSGGPVRRIRQKANLLSQGSYLSKHISEFGSTSSRRPGVASQKLLLMNEPEPKLSKTVEEKGVTSMHSSGYASVPTKSTQMAAKILEQLERLSPKERSSGSRLAGTSEKSPIKHTSNMLHGEALRRLEKVDSPQDAQKSDDQRPAWLPNARESTSQGKEKVEENGPRKFAIPRDMLTSVNGNSSVPEKDSAPTVPTTDNSFKLPAGPPQKKRAFQMSAQEDSLELGDAIQSNGHVSIPLDENKKPETSTVTSKDVSVEALPEIAKTPIPEVSKSSVLPELPKPDDAIPSPKTDSGLPSGSVKGERKVGFTFSTSPPSSSTSQLAVSQSTSVANAVSPPKVSNPFPSFGTSDKSAEKVPPVFSANGPSDFKSNAGSDPKPLGTNSLFSSATKNNGGQFSIFNKDETGNGQKSLNMFGKSDPSSSASPALTSANGIFSFSGSTKNSSITNGTPATNPSIFSSSPSFPASGTSTNKLFNTNSSSSSIISTSDPTPIFSSGPAVASSTFASTTQPSVTESLGTDTIKDKEPKSNQTTSSPFTTGNSIFGFGSPANAQTSAAAPMQAAPFKFVSSAPSIVSGTAGIPSSTSGNSLLGSSAPSFGLSSAVASSDSKSGGLSSTTNIFGNASQLPKPSAFGSTFNTPPAAFSFGASSTSTPAPAPASPPAVFSFGAPPASSSPAGFSFGASSTSMATISTFGSPNTGASMFSFTAAGATNSPFSAPSQPPSVFGAAAASPTNNDQMSMEDGMAEDSMQTPASAGAPGFMFGSATPTPTSGTPTFQFGGQTNQAPSQNPFQASGSVEFNAGGSFSLGSGGGDKSGRRIVRVKSKNRRK